MIFRLSQKLAKKIKVVPTVCAPLDPNPFADWSAHLFTADRAQYIIITNTASLYSVVTFGRGIPDDGQFLYTALTVIRDYMANDGMEFIYRRFIAPVSGEIGFSKPLNRGVTGSINNLVVHAKFQLAERKVSPFEAASLFNNIPMSPLDYRKPREAFKGMMIDQEAP